MRKTATMLGVCAILAAAAAPGGALPPKPRPPTPATSEGTSSADIDRGMSDAARDYAAKKKALAQQFRQKRQALTGDAAWKALSSAERKAQLKALQGDYKTQQERLRDDYQAQVKAFKARKEQTQEAAPKDTERRRHERSVWEREPRESHGMPWR